LRRDSPQASRSRHRRAGRPILSPLIPGCSVAGDQGPSRLLIRARCRVGVRKVSAECELATPGQRPSAPRPQGRRMLAADGCASSSSNPGVLLLRRLGPRRAERVAVAMFGAHWFLGMLICRCECADPCMRAMRSTSELEGSSHASARGTVAHLGLGVRPSGAVREPTQREPLTISKCGAYLRDKPRCRAYGCLTAH
jgi:hypothetical protein